MPSGVATGLLGQLATTKLSFWQTPSRSESRTADLPRKWPWAGFMRVFLPVLHPGNGRALRIVRPQEIGGER
jgi:hypothetical protein